MQEREIFQPLENETDEETIARRRKLLGPFKPPVTPIGKAKLAVLQGEWRGKYTEDGERGQTRYTLYFDEHGGITGNGHDADGDFSVECGVWSTDTDRLVW